MVAERKKKEEGDRKQEEVRLHTSFFFAMIGFDFGFLGVSFLSKG